MRRCYDPMNTQFRDEISKYLNSLNKSSTDASSVKRLYQAVSHTALNTLQERWNDRPEAKRACYFSAEFLTGRLIYSNLMNLGLLEECSDYFMDCGLDFSALEDVEDCALGNGGLGRLAVCLLDSGATHGIPLDGYGIRYRYGLFKQSFKNGFQQEEPDDWLKFGDPWSVRREDCSVEVNFGSEKLLAVPYDMPVIGYGGKCINTLRLWQAEAIDGFDLGKFNDQDYAAAFRGKNSAEAISQVLYPNDSTREGKELRLKQQYFFSSASLQSILHDFKRAHGDNFSALPDFCAIQLNDTHPVVSIPELFRLLVGERHLNFYEAFPIVQRVFSYTNHTVMAEALETWDVNLFVSVLPEIYPYVVMIQNHLFEKLAGAGVSHVSPYRITGGNMISMANLAVYVSRATNGVAAIHTEILKDTVLRQWHDLYPEKIQNKTNGITQRRWLKLCNRELSELITKHIGDGWIMDLRQLEKLRPLADDPSIVDDFSRVKKAKKSQLCDYIYKREGILIGADFIFDVQVKRLHEYKRQLLNALNILDTYYSIKEGAIKDFHPTVYIFGGKAAPGYVRAKGIIKFINEVAKLLEKDPSMKDLMKVVFVQNYNVSYAEKIVPAADISQQISTAGTEASGTGNMKLMLNGAVTLGTLDGANIEIVQQAGFDSNYVFGANVDEIAELEKSYDPNELFEREPRIRRAMGALLSMDDGGSGVFRELYNSILKGTYWHRADQYYLLHDFLSYCDARTAANRDYCDRESFSKKCFLNMASAGEFSSDRTVLEYARDIWEV